jgi:hypothetical protein
MISRNSIAKVMGGAYLALILSGWGCLSMQSQSTIDGNSANGSTQPYVEAYFEYPGPQEKWSGPASFILHVVAKDSGAAQITITPALVVDSTAPDHQENPTVSQRVPASALSTAVSPAIHKMTGEEAREQLAQLSTALQGAQAPFRGCMSPVRVRLVRADGALLEKQGCRSEMGWSRAVSDSVSSFMNASIYGTAAPAAASKTQASSAPAQHDAAATAAHGGGEASRSVANAPASANRH